ncbi:MAG: COX15/CtaA family protein [Gemmatimonadetes bacterium]|nr:COX15/CtaA family protein [Gemmatimonadota bacterium]
MAITSRPAHTAAVTPGVPATALPARAGHAAQPTADDAAVRRWLVATAWSVVAAVVVGGITRLTESGLSITVWEPVAGILPPLSHADWERAYQAYLRIPEAQTVHRGITLGGYQALFWWEWFHRLVARGVGLVIAVPYLWLLVRRRFRPGQAVAYGILPVLVALQGALGWYMVSSGLSVRTDVSQYRLVAHLLLALTIFVVAVWRATTLGRATRAVAERADDRASRGVARALALLSTLAFATIASGGFVAGLDGGKVYNEFPLMGGQFVPREYAELVPAWRNWFDNPVAAQFNHRVLALSTVLAACLLLLAARRAMSGAPWRAMQRVAVVALAQAVLGVTTLLLAVPVVVAALHQLGAVALLASVLVATNEARAARV